MTAVQAFQTFVRYALAAARAVRYVALADTKKGAMRILGLLDHNFDSALRNDLNTGQPDNAVWTSACFAFHRRIGFGAEFATAQEAYDQLSLADGWLILARDASFGIYRPEARWDEERLILP